MRTLDRIILESLYWKPYQTAQELALRLERSPHRVTGRLRWMEKKRMVCTGALVNQLFTWRLSARMQRRQRLDIRSDSAANSLAEG